MAGEISAWVASRKDAPIAVPPAFQADLNLGRALRPAIVVAHQEWEPRSWWLQFYDQAFSPPIPKTVDEAVDRIMANGGHPPAPPSCRERPHA